MEHEFTFTISGPVDEVTRRTREFWEARPRFSITRQESIAGNGTRLWINRKGDRVAGYDATMAITPTEGATTIKVMSDARAAQLVDLGENLDLYCSRFGIPTQNLRKIGVKEMFRNCGIYWACCGIAIGLLVLFGLLSR
jgi:hypothetical protein